MSKFARRTAVSALFMLAASACEDLPTERDSEERPSEVIDTAPIVRFNPPVTADAGAPDLGVIDAGLNNTLDATVVIVEGTDSGPPSTSGFAAAYAVFSANCVSCHGAGKTLDLSTAQLAHAQLVGVEAKYKACAATEGAVPKLRVVPGAPESSLLIEKIEGHPSCGKQMPSAMLMSDQEITIVRAWVAAGAPSP